MPNTNESIQELRVAHLAIQSQVQQLADLLLRTIEHYHVLEQRVKDLEARVSKS